MRSHRLSAACSRWKFNCTCTHIPSNRRLQTHSGSSSVFDIETSTIGLYSFDLLDFHCIFRIWARFYRCNRANIIRFPSVLFVALTSNLSYSQPSTHVSWFHSNSPPRSGILILLLHFLSITQAFFYMPKKLFTCYFSVQITAMFKGTQKYLLCTYCLIYTCDVTHMPEAFLNLRKSKHLTLQFPLYFVPYPFPNE